MLNTVSGLQHVFSECQLALLLSSFHRHSLDSHSPGNMIDAPPEFQCVSFLSSEDSAPRGRAQLSASFLRISFQSPPAESTLVHCVLLSKLCKPRKENAATSGFQAEHCGQEVLEPTCPQALLQTRSFSSSARGQREPQDLLLFQSRSTQHRHPSLGTLKNLQARKQAPPC